MPPQTAYDKDKGGNPYLVLGGMDGTVDVVAREMTGETLEQRVKAAGAGQLTLERDTTTPAPILLVKVDAKTPEGAQAGLTLLTGEVPRSLVRLQDAVHVPQNALITSTVVAASDQPTIVRSRSKLLMMAGAAGLILTLFLYVAVDNIARARARRLSGAARTRRRLRPASGLPEARSAATTKPEARRSSLMPLAVLTSRPHCVDLTTPTLDVAPLGRGTARRHSS